MIKFEKFKLNTLKQVLFDLQTDEIRAVEKEPEIEFLPSEEYKSKINTLINSIRKDGKIKVLGWRKIIVIISAITLLLALTLTAIAIREEIIAFLESKTDGGIKLNVTGETPELIEGYYLPAKIPEGFVNTYLNDDKKHMVTEWEREEELICLEQILMSEGDQVDMDTESETYRKEQIGRFTVYYIFKYGTHNAVWKNDKYVFILYCESDALTFEEIKELILSMKVEPIETG